MSFFRWNDINLSKNEIRRVKRKIRQVFNALLLLTDLPHTRRDSIPFAQWSPEALGAGSILVSVEKDNWDSNFATSVGATPHCGARLLRLRKPPTRFPPLAVLGGFPPSMFHISDPLVRCPGQDAIKIRTTVKVILSFYVVCTGLEPVTPSM